MSKVIQVWCVGVLGIDEVVRTDVVLAGGLPEGTELSTHVAPLMIRVLMAGWHLLDRVNVHVDVGGGVRGVEHLPVGQHKAACGVLGKRKEGPL